MSETSITWALPPTSFPFLREHQAVTSRPSGRISAPGLHVVGWSNCERSGRGYYIRRMWLLKSHDFDRPTGRGFDDYYPAEAVDVQSIAINVPSKQLHGRRASITSQGGPR